jgi:hypothetical protein
VVIKTTPFVSRCKILANSASGKILLHARPHRNGLSGVLSHQRAVDHPMYATRQHAMPAVGTQPAGMPPASNPFHRRMHLGVTDGAPRAESLEALAPLTPAMSQKPTFPRALNPDLQTFLNKRVGRAQPPAYPDTLTAAPATSRSVCTQRVAPPGGVWVWCGGMGCDVVGCMWWDSRPVGSALWGPCLRGKSSLCGASVARFQPR